MPIPLKQGDGAYPVYLVDVSGNPIPGSGGLPVTIAGPLGAGGGVKVEGVAGGVAQPVASQSGTWTDKSGTIATGGTAQTPVASNANRKAYFIQNLSSGDLYVSLVGTAVQTQPSVKIAPGASLFSSGNFISTQAISIIGATTGQVFTAWEA